jgi:hypothetical protein
MTLLSDPCLQTDVIVGRLPVNKREKGPGANKSLRREASLLHHANIRPSYRKLPPNLGVGPVYADCPEQICPKARREMQSRLQKTRSLLLHRRSREESVSILQDYSNGKRNGPEDFPSPFRCRAGQSSTLVPSAQEPSIRF